MSQPAASTLADLRSHIRAFVRERDWEQFHSPKHLSMSIAIEAAELMECFQWQSAGQATEDVTQNGAPQAAVDELADVLIYCLSMANALGIEDLAAAVLDKLERSGKRYPPDQLRGHFALDKK
ncbi:MAG: nucleotide pyrophosphohydrolase [Ardenticatenales bacterium]|nr:nucleotide pyrophosphohydrolase [Ardenticatenales bacterium]